MYRHHSKKFLNTKIEYASGAKLKTWEDGDKLINYLNELAKNYKN